MAWQSCAGQGSPWRHTSSSACIMANCAASSTALQIIRQVGADTVVLVVLRPLPNTPMAKVASPGAEVVGRLAAVARLLMPDTPLMLGCARPAGPAKVPMERLAVLAGANVVAYPDPETVQLAAEIGLQTGFLESCCTLVDAKRLR